VWGTHDLCARVGGQGVCFLADDTPMPIRFNDLTTGMRLMDTPSDTRTVSIRTFENCKNGIEAHRSVCLSLPIPMYTLVIVIAL
jgi:hypothetical protein